MKKMNTKYFIISVLSLTLLSSCVKNDITGDTIVTKEFVASVCESTKTTINDDCSVDWAKNDIIRYFSADKGNVGEYIVSEDGHTTDISASIGINDTYFVAAYGGTGISSNNTDGFTLEGVMPKIQDGSFKNAHVAVAKTTNLKDKYISFNNLTSMVSFSFSRDDVHYVVFKATDGTKINDNGKLDIVFDGNTPSAQISEDGSSETRINCGGAGTFYLSTLACTMESFMIDCYDINDVCLGEVNSKGSLVLARNYIVELGQLDGLMEPKYETTTDLSLKGTANCYIVSAPGKYKIKATVKGGSTESIEGTPAKAEVLWESFMTSTAPSVGDLIARASYADGYITFSTPTTLNNGNAAIAIKDKEDRILWSWHIWICEGYDIEETAQVYKYNAGTMMDRNLGALSATPGDTLTYGLYYQWGRKDPFMANYYYYGYGKKIHIESTPSFPPEPHTDVNTSTVAFSVAHPMTMIQRNELNYNWCYTGTAKADTTLWRSSSSPKGVYDPCPVGWRVPDGGDNNVWTRAFGLYKEDYNFGQSSAMFSVYDIPEVNEGINLGSGNGLSTDKQVGTDDVIWYPEAGQIVVSNGAIAVYNIKLRGFCWACPNYGYYFCNFTIGINANGGCDAPAYGNNWAGSFSVRCIKEGSQGPLVLPPNVKTASVSAVSATAAMCGGNVVSAGSASVTGRGVVWGEVKGPTLENCAGKTSNGSGKGEFTSKLTGLSPSTKYYVRAYATNSAGTRYGGEMEFTTGKEGLDYVDLGLSVKWATFNLGATSQEECGDYYAWGEIEPYTADGYRKASPCYYWRSMTTGAGNTSLSNGYSWKSYSRGGASSFVEWSVPPYDIETYELKPERDAATVKWGELWRMPTELETNELLTCKWTWTNNYQETGVSGYVISGTKTGFTDKSIFLPVTGIRVYSIIDLKTYGDYWASTLNKTAPERSMGITFNSSEKNNLSAGRLYGCNIRPVYGSKEHPKFEDVSISSVTASSSNYAVDVTCSEKLRVGSCGVVWGTEKEPVWNGKNTGTKSCGEGTGKFSCTLTDLKPSTKYYVRAYAYYRNAGCDGSYVCVYGPQMEFTTATSDTYEYVDMGLSVKWATFNVGAAKPEESGDYYAWGELEPYYADGYSQESPCTHWRNMTTGGGNTDLSGGYCWTSYSKGGPSSFVEWSNVPYAQKDLRYEPNQSLKSLVLKPDRDVATVKWGGSWRMPTHLDLIELFRNTTQRWTDDYNGTGVSGYVITSTVPGFSGKSIFLPAAGDRYDTVFGGLGTHGWYWCSNMQVDGTKNCANCLYFVPDSFSYSYTDPREFGYSIRPVLE